MGSLDSLDPSSPPFIPVPGVANLRDIGGYGVSTPSKAVRQRIFYRAADPCACDDASIRKLRNELGISIIFDLRAKPEMDRNVNTAGDVTAFENRLSEVSSSSDSDGKGVIKREWAPVFQEADYSPEGVAMRFRDYATEGTAGFVRAYAEIAANGVSAYGRIFKHLASIPPLQQSGAPTNQGVLIHCTAGKDRTGVFVALLLSLLGVDDETIAREYTLTEVGLRGRKSDFVERIMANPAFSGPGGPGREGALRMTTCTDEKMLDTLKMVRAKYGGAEGYVKQVLGLTDEEVRSIREALTVDAGRSQSTL